MVAAESPESALMGNGGTVLRADFDNTYLDQLAAKIVAPMKA
jgi:hypothetical protein